jgi:hypothetical protein
MVHTVAECNGIERITTLNAIGVLALLNMNMWLGWRTRMAIFNWRSRITTAGN